jgi:hypothetical protein
MARIVEGAAAAISQTGPRKIASETLREAHHLTNGWLNSLGRSTMVPGGLLHSGRAIALAFSRHDGGKGWPQLPLRASVPRLRIEPFATKTGHGSVASVRYSAEERGDGDRVPRIMAQYFFSLEDGRKLSEDDG